MMMKGVSPLRLTLQKQHPQTHASASVSTTPSAKLRLSGARRSCSLQVKDHLPASWISRAGAAAARFPAGGPPRLYQERQVRRRGLEAVGALRLPKSLAPHWTITAPNLIRPITTQRASPFEGCVLGSVLLYLTVMKHKNRLEIEISNCGDCSTWVGASSHEASWGKG